MTPLESPLNPTNRKWPVKYPKNHGNTGGSNTLHPNPYECQVTKKIVGLWEQVFCRGPLRTLQWTIYKINLKNNNPHIIPRNILSKSHGLFCGINTCSRQNRNQNQFPINPSIFIKHSLWTFSSICLYQNVGNDPITGTNCALIFSNSSFRTLFKN